MAAAQYAEMAVARRTEIGLMEHPKRTGTTMPKDALTLLLAAPRGFCAGVDRAIQIVERALERYGAPVYVRHEIVHNRHVVEELERKGAIFVEDLEEIPGQFPVVFSAHGVPKSVPEDAEQRKLLYLDATCPLVSKVHREAEVHFAAGRHIILIGHAGHPEVIGTIGQLPPGAVTLVETSDDAEEVTPPSDRPRLHHADHAVDRRHRSASSTCCAGAFPRSTGRARKTSATPPPTARRR